MPTRAPDAGSGARLRFPSCSRGAHGIGHAHVEVSNFGGHRGSMEDACLDEPFALLAGYCSAIVLPVARRVLCLLGPTTWWWRFQLPAGYFSCTAAWTGLGGDSHTESPAASAPPRTAENCSLWFDVMARQGKLR
ncbi:hypothetical protein ON010_g12396 [Phytophthora cinnamomi]|nr:hypothetical protein ON010_g12396 [Phytophthora cinnamomi]